LFHFRYPCLHTVRILLQCGADINARNAIKNTPLHVFVSNSCIHYESIFQLLCNNGAHLDYANALGETPIDIATNANMQQLLKSRTKLCLKCLCARLIQKSNIPFHGNIAHSLVDFVTQH
jgi:Fem-1 family protein b